MAPKTKAKLMKNLTQIERTYIILITALATVITTLCVYQIIINY